MSPVRNGYIRERRDSHLLVSEGEDLLPVSSEGRTRTNGLK